MGERRLSVARPTQPDSDRRRGEMQMPKRVVELAVEELEVRGGGRTADAQPGEQPVDDLTQRPRPGEDPVRQRRSTPRGSHEGVAGRRRQDAALLGPLHEIAVLAEPLDRAVAAPPAHRVGKVQAQVARSVKDPSLCHAPEVPLTTHSIGGYTEPLTIFLVLDGKNKGG